MTRRSRCVWIAAAVLVTLGAGGLAAYFSTDSRANRSNATGHAEQPRGA